MEQARNYTLAVILKLSLVESNRHALGLHDAGLLSAVAEVVEIDRGETQLKALDILSKLLSDSDNRREMLTKNQGIIDVLQTQLEDDFGEKKSKILDVLLLLIDNLTLLQTTILPSLTLKFVSVIKTEHAYLLQKREEQMTAGNRVTIVELEALHAVSYSPQINYRFLNI